MKRIYFLLFSLFTFIKLKAELYTSISRLEQLLDTQRSLIETMDSLLNAKKNKNKIVKSYLELLKKEHKEAMNDTSKYLGNPITSFRLIKRLTVDLDFIDEVLNKVTVFKRNKNVTYPTQKDLVGAAQGILRLQTTYGLSVTDLANGVMNTSFGKASKWNVNNFTPMSISDCYELGLALFSGKYYPPGIEWLKEASRKLKEYDKTTSEGNRITLEDIQNKLLEGYRKSEEQLSDFIKWFHEITHLRPDIEYNINKVDRDKIVTYYKRGMSAQKALDAIRFGEKVSDSYNPQGMLNISFDKLNLSYTALCRGKRVSKKIFSKHASCYLAHGPHPFLILAPIKAERLLVAPNFTLFYNVVSDAEIEAIQALAKPKMARARVSLGYIAEKSFERTSQTTFVFSNELESVARVRRRVDHFTGMNVATCEASESLQVMNYGIGGYHKMHYDYSTNETFIKKEGNRLATINFFLSDVEQGGATVFPAVGLAVFPVKGAALFWMNLLDSGQGDPTAFHAACPVLLGSKWVATQWVNTLCQQ